MTCEFLEAESGMPDEVSHELWCVRSLVSGCTSGQVLRHTRWFSTEKAAVKYVDWLNTQRSRKFLWMRKYTCGGPGIKEADQ